MKKFLKNGRLLTLTILGVVAALVAMFFIQPPANAAVDNGRDCDTVAIIRCGVHSMQEIDAKWDGNHRDSKYKDVAKVFGAFGISKSDLNGFVAGVVWKDGRVTVGNETVATNATTAGRWNNPSSDMTRIPGTERAYKMSTRHFVDEGQTAFVKMVNGRFSFAVLKSCGNPVVAKPVPPKPQSAAACTNLDVIQLSRTTHTFKFDAKATASGGAKVSAFVYNVKDESGKTLLNRTVPTTATSSSTRYQVSKPGKYTVQVTVKTSIGDKTGSQCKDTFEIKTVPPRPVAACTKLEIDPISRSNYTLRAAATVSGGATISGYTYTATKEGRPVFSRTVSTTATSSSIQHDFQESGLYAIQVTVKTSVGNKTSDACKKSLLIKAQPQYECTNLTFKRIGKEEENRYEFTASYTTGGGAILRDADFDFGDDIRQENVRPNTGSKTVTVQHAYGQPGNYTIVATLHFLTNVENGRVVDSTCQAKLAIAQPEEKLIEVCNPETGEIIQVPESEAGKYEDVDSPACQEVPEELPVAGSTLIGTGLGIGSLTAAGYYWSQSRRALLLKR